GKWVISWNSRASVDALKEEFQYFQIVTPEISDCARDICVLLAAFIRCERPRVGIESTSRWPGAWRHGRSRRAQQPVIRCSVSKSVPGSICPYGGGVPSGLEPGRYLDALLVLSNGQEIPGVRNMEQVVQLRTDLWNFTDCLHDIVRCEIRS